MDIRRVNSFTPTVFNWLSAAAVIVVALINYPLTVSAQVFPVVVQQRIDAGRYSPPSLVSQSALLDRYEIVDSNDGSLNHLLRYSIGDGSEFDNSQVDFQLPYAGAMWLLMADEYSIDSFFIDDVEIDHPRHQMVLFDEQILPDEGFLFDDPSAQQIPVFLSTDSLLTGRGMYYELGGFHDPQQGMLSSVPLGCLAQSCFVGAELNLLGVQYVRTGNIASATFPPLLQPAIEGQLLYSDFNGFEGEAGFDDEPFQNTRSFVVNAVPELLLGDCNQDGFVNFLDISPFILLLSNGEFLAEADVNQDGDVNFLDIGPFITLLSN